MLLVIFGAGASYDSVADTSRFTLRDVLEYRPPLAQELLERRQIFDEVIDRFEQCTPLVSRLRRTLEGGAFLEAELRAYQDEAEVYPPHYRHLAAFRFYLQQVLWQCGRRWHALAHGMTNYLDFFYRLDRWRTRIGETVCVVTFNYDLLLESAVSAAIQMSFQSVDSYVSSDEYKVFKLHGSVNWGRPVPAPGSGFNTDADIARQALISSADSLEVLDRYVLRSPDQHPGDYSNGTILYPAISIPVEAKSQFECPAEHLGLLQRYLPDVYRILVVGWRGGEEHFMRLLMDGVTGKAPAIQVVGDRDDGVQETVGNLERGGNFYKGKMQEITGGFSNYLRTKQLEDFLGDE